MSTEYKLLEDGSREVELQEHSGVFDLFYSDVVHDTRFGSFTPEELMQMAMKMVLAASYHMAFGVEHSAASELMDQTRKQAFSERINEPSS